MKMLYHGNLGIGVKTEAKKKPVLIVHDMRTDKEEAVATFSSEKAAERFAYLLLRDINGELRDR